MRGKGGWPIEAPILCDKAVERSRARPLVSLSRPKVPLRADIHSYRADYCKRIYEMHARPIDEISKCGDITVVAICKVQFTTSKPWPWHLGHLVITGLVLLPGIICIVWGDIMTNSGGVLLKMF